MFPALPERSNELVVGTLLGLNRVPSLLRRFRQKGGGQDVVKSWVPTTLRKKIMIQKNNRETNLKFIRFGQGVKRRS